MLGKINFGRIGKKVVRVRLKIRVLKKYIRIGFQQNNQNLCNDYYIIKSNFSSKEKALKNNPLITKLKRKNITKPERYGKIYMFK